MLNLVFPTYSVPESAVLMKAFHVLAKRHPTRKFMQIRATKCVPNFQDEDVPCLLFYKDGELTENLAGTACRTVFGGTHATVETVEYVLAMQKKFLDGEFEDDPRDALKTFNAFIHKKKAFMGRDEDQSGSDGEDDREYISNQLFRYKHKTKC